MSDPLRQELLDIFVGRATKRYGLSAINQLQHALQAAAHAEAVRLRRYDEAAKDPRARTPDFDHYLRHVTACRL